MEHKALSIAKFRDKTGNLDVSKIITDKDKIEFELAKLMNKILDVLQISIGNERQFKSARYEVLHGFHETYSNIIQRNEQE